MEHSLNSSHGHHHGDHDGVHERGSLGYAVESLLTVEVAKGPYQWYDQAWYDQAWYLITWYLITHTDILEVRNDTTAHGVFVQKFFPGSLLEPIVEEEVQLALQPTVAHVVGKHLHKKAPRAVSWLDSHKTPRISKQPLAAKTVSRPCPFGLQWWSKQRLPFLSKMLRFIEEILAERFSSIGVRGVQRDLSH